MKKLLVLVFILACINAEAQLQRGIEKSDIRRGLYASFSAGVSSPIGDYKSYSQINTNADGQIQFGATEEINGKVQFNIDAGYQFGAFGMGLSLGTLKHEISDLSLQSDLVNMDFPLLASGGAIDGFYSGVGPEYTLSFGKFSTTATTRIGLMNFSTSTLTGSYNGDDADAPIELIQTELASDGKTSLAYSSVGLKLSYAITKQLSLFTKTAYSTTLGNGLKVTDSGMPPRDIDKDKQITAFDLQYPGESIPFENERFLKPQMVDVVAGLTWHFSTARSQKSKVSVRGWDPKQKSQFNNAPGGTTSPDDVQPGKLPIREGGRTVSAGDIPEKSKADNDLPNTDDGDFGNDVQRVADLKKLADELVNVFAINDVTWSDMDGDGHADAKRGIEKSDIRRGMVIAKPSANRSYNPDSEEEKRLASGELKNLYPPGVRKSPGFFESLDEIEYFAWEQLGEEIPDANYVIEIAKIGKDGQVQEIFLGTSTQRTGRNPQTGKEIKVGAAKVAKFKAGKALADVVKRTGNQDETGEGHYQWTVTEKTTGITSKPGYFSISKKKDETSGYNESSTMLIVKADQTALRNTNTSISNQHDESAGIRALRANDARHGVRANDARHGFSARHNDARMKTVSANDERMKTARSNDERIKSIRSNDEQIKPVRMNDARIKDARSGIRADKRYEGVQSENSGLNNKPVEIITDENFKVAPQTNIDTKYARIRNKQTVQISKGYLQLIAPLVPDYNDSKAISYKWTVKDLNKNGEQSFSGNRIHYDFNTSGTYEIEITPTVDNEELSPCRTSIIVN